MAFISISVYRHGLNLASLLDVEIETKVKLIKFIALTWFNFFKINLRKERTCGQRMPDQRTDKRNSRTDEGKLRATRKASTLYFINNFVDHHKKYSR